MSETDEEFLDRIADYLDDYSGIPKEVRVRLLALARRGAAVQWRPIEEAPKDGTLFLAPSMDGKTVTVGSWSKFYNCWYDRLVGHLNGHWKPTHFMPLPPPPSGEPEHE